ncbi:metabotropic glutamate receptor 3-like isoform X2 [Physella acuta]|uniref:metabotropic glutamate receptor 3-like isoform X2 n=1 Tax=Physella acuta TaxID=109671 RepID=UPI0027DE5AD4|nr:metabotropic glutamate receptor 3-like isoform X2 [Physella acuta]
MWLLQTLCLAFICLTGVASQSQTCPTTFTTSECYFNGAATKQPAYSNPNQFFIVGGLFDVHNKGDGDSTDLCSTALSDTGIFNALAFFWAIDRYSAQIIDTNRSSVGAVAFDNCMRPELTIEHILSYSQCDIHIQNLPASNLVAFVGPYTNEDATRAGSIAGDLKITLVSPTANALDQNISKQKTLLRLSPSFLNDLKAIVEFLKLVKSGYVIIIYAGSDSFWKAAFDELKNQMDQSICIQYTADFKSMPINDLLDALKSRIKAKYIVPLMSKADLDTLFNNINLRTEIADKFNYILTSAIGQDSNFLTLYGKTTNNTVVIDQVDKMPISSQDWSAFTTYLTSVQNNITLAKYIPADWLTSFSSKLPSDWQRAPTPLIHSIVKTLTSVYSVIKGIDKIMRDGCASGANYQFCDRFRNQPNSKQDYLYSGILDSSQSFIGNQYKYSLFYVGNSIGSFKDIGTVTVSSSSLTVKFDVNVMDVNQYGYQFSEPVCPISGQCCEPPTTVAPTTISMTTQQPVISSTGSLSTVPVQYPLGQVITGAYQNVYRANEEYGTRFDLGHKWIIALGVLAGLGILCVIIFEIYILYKLLGTRMGKQWRTMWLGQLLLFGIFLCYLVLFAYLPIPTKATCGITRFGVGVSYAFCFAVLLVKLMVILTSKTSEVLFTGELESPNYLKGIYQFLLFIFAVGVQIVIDIQWLIIVPPEAVKVTTNNGDKVWVCNHYTWEVGNSQEDVSKFTRTNFENHLMSLIYIMVMILITTILSLRAHGIITNHRESIFIGLAAGFSIPIWLAWGLIGGLNKNHAYSEEFGDGCVAFGLLITASLILFVMFLPKVRQLVNMGVEGIYLEDDRETIYGGSVIIPPSYKSKGPSSVIFVNNQGIYSEPVIIGNGDPMATHLKHPGSSLYSAPPTYLKKAESAYGGSTRVLRMTDDLKGRHPQKRPQSEIAFGSSGRPRSNKGTLPRSRSHTNLGAL